MENGLADNYLPNISLTSYFRSISNRFPDFYKTLWFNRPNSSPALKELDNLISDFEGCKKRGRGDYYRKAQRDVSVRIAGIKQILKLASQNQDIEHLSPTYKILDVLGGDGILARVFRIMYPGNNFRQPILTSDCAADMIAQALKYNLPAIRQQAQFLFIRDNSFDAVILAYGTHHIPKKDRLLACQEAFRVLKPGGNIVIHDFEENSPIARWFNEVVNKYSITGHKYCHFAFNDFRLYLQRSGFKNIRIFSMYDPFVTKGSSKEVAFQKLMDYIFNMYGLAKLQQNTDAKDVSQKIYRLIEKYIHYELNNIKEARPYWKSSISFYQDKDQFIAELPRVALVGVGTK